jgi:hypothetical protein
MIYRTQARKKKDKKDKKEKKEKKAKKADEIQQCPDRVPKGNTDIFAYDITE